MRENASVRQTVRSIPHWYETGEVPPSIVDGSGSRVYDEDGTEYLDFLAQLYCVNAGHDEDRIVDAITEQLARIPYVSPSKRNDTRTELVRRLVEVSPEPLDSVILSVSGSEANEIASLIAREFTDRQKVLTRWRSYHGATYGAGSLTGDPQTRGVVERHAATTGSGKFLPPLPEVFDAEGEALTERAADHVEFVVRNEGPDTIAAIMLEPVAGTSGAYTAPPGYFERIREICDEYDILLIADEVITGFGRCGDWFGIQTEGIDPDLITFAKGVTSGYVPLAGVIARSDVGRWLEETGVPIGQTFAGHPVGCAAGVAAMDAYDDRLIENVRSLESHFQGRLDALSNRHDVISDVHGRGFHWSVEFADPDTGDPFFDPRVDEGDNPVETVREVAQEEGVLFGSGRPDVQVLLSPPLCATGDDIDEAVDVLDEAIESVFG